MDDYPFNNIAKIYKFLVHNHIGENENENKIVKHLMNAFLN